MNVYEWILEYKPLKWALVWNLINNCSVELKLYFTDYKNSDGLLLRYANILVRTCMYVCVCVVILYVEVLTIYRSYLILKVYSSECKHSNFISKKFFEHFIHNEGKRKIWMHEKRLFMLVTEICPNLTILLHNEF